MIEIFTFFDLERIVVSVRGASSGDDIDALTRTLERLPQHCSVRLDLSSVAIAPIDRIRLLDSIAHIAATGMEISAVMTTSSEEAMQAA